MLRRLLERLEEVFEEIYTPGSDTKYNLQIGAKGSMTGMAMYVCSSNQRIFNSYLKEEIFHTLKQVPRIRIILDEMAFSDENDELLKFLLQSRRQRKIELVLVSQNIKDVMRGNMELDFSNIVMFLHGTSAITDEVSTDLFGSYQYHFPVPTAGNTPHVFFSVKKAVHWQVQSEERPRVRSLDLYARPLLFGKTSDYLAIKTIVNANVYLIHVSDFLPVSAGVPLMV